MSAPGPTSAQIIANLEANVRKARKGSKERAFWELHLQMERQRQDPEYQRQLTEAAAAFPDLFPQMPTR